MKYKVTVARHWVEHGTIEVEASDDDEARDFAEEVMRNGDNGIEWGEMSPEEDDVELVEEV